MATIGQQLTSPEAGWKRYDDTIACSKTTFPYGSYTSYYNGGGHATQTSGLYYSFDFIGTKLRIITTVVNDHSNNVKITIDGNIEYYSEKPISSSLAQCLVFEKSGLANVRHTVKIESTENGVYTSIDAIDIDSTGRLLHPDEVTDIKDLDVGKRIRCHYTAPVSGQVGVFSNLGQETYKDGINDFIPPTSSATPDGDFYFIMVEDWNGKKRLIADRNIQHSISWDNLNIEGIPSGVTIPQVYFNPLDKGSGVTISGLGKTISITGLGNGVRVNKGKSSGKWYVEFSLINLSSGVSAILGIANSSFTLKGDNITGNKNIRGVNSYNGYKLPDASSYMDSFSGYDVLGMAIDLDNGTLEFFKNGVSKGICYTNIKTLGEVFPFVCCGSSSGTVSCSINTGSFPFKYPIPDGYLPYDEKSVDFNLLVRLPTGGISSSDTDNEWDKYIVNSTLNGKIQAGDNNVWNWRVIYSWTSTVNKYSSDRRTVRGNGSASNSCGFRPVLEIEQIEILYKFLIQSEDNLISNITAYQNFGKVESDNLPTMDTISKFGMEDINEILQPTSFIQTMFINQSPMGNGIYEETINVPKNEIYSKIELVNNRIQWDLENEIKPIEKLPDVFDILIYSGNYDEISDVTYNTNKYLLIADSGIYSLLESDYDGNSTQLIKLPDEQLSEDLFLNKGSDNINILNNINLIKNLPDDTFKIVAYRI